MGGGVKRGFIYYNILREEPDPGMPFDDPLHFKPHPIPEKHALGYPSGEPVISGGLGDVF
jgi:hypothetical protein